ncbi:CPCC family cysteine-rich protein [Desulfoluna butyratoxydans]|uniref:CPCC family cysteine-rich protein n=1 Tax=Desulfoluna butyratoxydans TaxID=231438 RepID=UPI001C55648A|nr:CPCC family cysteine-rich protein [Desulfoluna butyratoxydans]
MQKKKCKRCKESILAGTGLKLDGMCMPCFKKDNYGRTPKQIGRIGNSPCPCCGYYTLADSPGSYQICEICYWEDDIEQFRDPTYRGGANQVSLTEAQENFEIYGCCEECVKQYVRPVETTDKRIKDWKINT